MNKIDLTNITLIAADCVDLDRLLVVAEVCLKHIRFGAVKILSSIPSRSDWVIPIDPIRSKGEYSTFVVRELYKYVDTEYLLIFQNDGFILNPFGWRKEFWEYDYIGAPWLYYDEHNVGNGGFSLRTRRLMEVVATDRHILQCEPEDHIICRTYGEYLRKKGFKFAPDAVARHFSIENKKWRGEFGFHRADISDWDIYKFLDRHKYSRYIDLFHELKTIDPDNNIHFR
jgi:hypothetical protein